jgi:glycosyltransferase involved in cell wall biosynthesis
MNNQKYFISVILPNYNCSRFLEKSITSVLNQTYKNFELIIVDDCSTDSSKTIIQNFKKKDKRIRYFKTKNNSGNVAVPRNLGISKSRGHYVAFIDADDYWYPDKLSYQISNIKNYSLSFTAADYQIEGSKKKSGFFLNLIRITLQKFFLHQIRNKGFYWLYIYNPFLISSVLVNKKILYKNNFEADSNVREDLKLWLTLFKTLNKKFIFHSKILVTITRANLSMSHNKIEEFNKIINSLCNTFIKKKKYDFFYFFILGIFFRSIKLILTNIYKDFKKKIKLIFFSLIIIFFIFYYSPFFYWIGKKLVYYDPPKKTEALVVITGQQGFDYFNNSYKYRFFDIISYIEKFNGKNDTKIFLYGKLQFIPDQKILEVLLINESIKKENIIVIYEEYRSTDEAINLTFDFLKKYKINEVTYITNPYHSYRLHKLLETKKSHYKIYIHQNSNLPKKNNFFERSFNKKEIIYEYFSLIYNKISRKF